MTVDVQQRPGVLRGVLYTGLFHVAAAVILLIPDLIQRQVFVPEIMLVFGALIGITQLVYMIPAIIIAAFTKRRALMKGFIIGAALTMLLNALCAGIMMANMSRF